MYKLLYLQFLERTLVHPFGSSGIGCENGIMTKVQRYFDVCKDKEVIDQWATVKRNVQTKTILPKDKKVIFFRKDVRFHLHVYRQKIWIWMYIDMRLYIFYFCATLYQSLSVCVCVLCVHLHFDGIKRGQKCSPDFNKLHTENNQTWKKMSS